MGEKVIRVKVRPYPFEVLLDRTPKIEKGQILRLTMIGFQADVGNGLFAVGEHLKFSFHMPADYGFVTGSCRVMKTLDRAIESGVLRIVEFHFENLEHSMLSRVQKFVAVTQSMKKS